MLEGARVAVVVPAYDEARLIVRTLGSIPAFVDHVVVVDDASRDGTAEAVLTVLDPRIELRRHRENRGVGAAIVTGYRAAFAAGCDAVAVMAGDAQMDPADLSSLLCPVARGEADYVKGDRLSHPDVRRRMPFGRFVGNHALSHVTRAVTGLSIHDSQCGYTAIARAAAERLDLDALWPRYGYPNDLLSHLAVADLRVRDVVVRPIYGQEQSGIRLWHLVTSFPWVLGVAASRRLNRFRRQRAAAGRSSYEAPASHRGSVRSWPSPSADEALHATGRGG